MLILFKMPWCHIVGLSKLFSCSRLALGLLCLVCVCVCVCVCVSVCVCVCVCLCVCWGAVFWQHQGQSSQQINSESAGIIYHESCANRTLLTTHYSQHSHTHTRT